MAYCLTGETTLTLHKIWFWHKFYWKLQEWHTRSEIISDVHTLPDPKKLDNPVFPKWADDEWFNGRVWFVQRSKKSKRRASHSIYITQNIANVSARLEKQRCTPPYFYSKQLNNCLMIPLQFILLLSSSVHFCCYLLWAFPCCVCCLIT